MKEFRNLYIHVPFCLQKCDYCAFYSEGHPGEADFLRWLNHLQSQLEFAAESLRNVHTVYLGGGTPSILPPELLKRLADMLLRYCGFSPDVEISMEANPETVTPELCRAAAGFINRVSMGAQSFSDSLRSAAGRHTGNTEAIGNAVHQWRTSGIHNIGLDLLYALPGETLADFRHDLHCAVSLGITHLSCYSITPEEGTPFAATGYEPDDALSADMWDLAGLFLAEHGMPRYEISNYAANPFQARHNQNVWHGETYLGLGPSASSFDGVHRWTEVPSLNRWSAGVPPEIDDIPREERLREIFLMGLRTVRGWDTGEFRRATGAEADFPEITGLERDGLLVRSAAGVRCSEQGLMYWNEIGLRLLSPTQSQNTENTTQV